MRLSKYLPALVAVGISGNASAVQNPEHINTHGSACQSANLEQAIARDVRWTNEGLKNANEIGSGLSFFVVCPLVITDDNSGAGPDGSDIQVRINYDDHDGENQVSCFVRRWRNGEIVKQVSQAANLNAGFTGDSVISMNNITDTNDAAFNAIFDDFHSLTCLMQPGSTLNGYAYDFD